MIQTQLIRLDPPYNVIFTTERFFGLHIATLIVVDEATERNGKRVTTKLRTQCFPVTAPYAELDGDVWTGTELKDCHLVCRQGDTITLRTLKLFMEYCDKKGSISLQHALLMFSASMETYGLEMNLIDIKNGNEASDYKVELIFDEEEEEPMQFYDFPEVPGRKFCNVQSSPFSSFYFSTFFFLDDEASNMEGSIDNLISMRNSYMIVLKRQGLKSIKFTTKNKKYQSFVDELNKRK